MPSVSNRHDVGIAEARRRGNCPKGGAPGEDERGGCAAGDAIEQYSGRRSADKLKHKRNILPRATTSSLPDDRAMAINLGRRYRQRRVSCGRARRLTFVRPGTLVLREQVQLGIGRIFPTCNRSRLFNLRLHVLPPLPNSRPKIRRLVREPLRLPPAYRPRITSFLGAGISAVKRVS